MLMANDEIKETHTLSLEEQNMSIIGNSYRREMLTQETGFVIQMYGKHKREKMMKNSKASEDKKLDETER